jgi:hypothetical protein
MSPTARPWRVERTPPKVGERKTPQRQTRFAPDPLLADCRLQRFKRALFPESRPRLWARVLGFARSLRGGRV